MNEQAHTNEIIYQGLLGNKKRNTIAVRRNGKSKRIKHYVQHSPTGFSWGYLGSGPAEAARCILIDFLQLKPHRSLGRTTFPEIDGGIYQSFESDMIASLPISKGWEITGKTIATWLENHPLRRTCEECRTHLFESEIVMCGICDLQRKIRTANRSCA